MQSKAYDLDVAVPFGFRILRGCALEIARYGVWSYHHGDNQVKRGMPVMEGEAVTGSILQVLTEELDGGPVIYRSCSRTDPHSVARSRRKYYWKSAAFLLRTLRGLHEEGPGLLRENPSTEAGPVPYVEPRAA